MTGSPSTLPPAVKAIITRHQDQQEHEYAASRVLTDTEMVRILFQAGDCEDETFSIARARLHVQMFDLSTGKYRYAYDPVACTLKLFVGEDAGEVVVYEHLRPYCEVVRGERAA